MAISTELFMNLPEDLFGFFKMGVPDGKKVVDSLGYTKREVATATGVALSSIRYDDKIPAALVTRLIEWATAINLVGSYFKDSNKALLWFQTPNPLLGGVAPRDMIRVGRSRKLLSFIQTALSENKPSA